MISSISYTPFTFFMLQKKWHVNVSNIVDFMTKKNDFQESNFFINIIFLPSNHCVVDTII